MRQAACLTNNQIMVSDCVLFQFHKDGSDLRLTDERLLVG